MAGQAKQRPISLAILALGGQGGGVLADWIASLAEENGWLAQSTSVPGVAQRTGATIYYLEILPEALSADESPVLSLTPVPGDVDIVLAAELMEAGRAIQRGFVTPNRTTLIASTHRSFAIAEKIVPGDGIADSAKVIEACRAAAQRFLSFDMAQAAEQSGSVMSAVLFGALARSQALPFARSAFEDTIRRGGVGVEASLRAFAIGYDRVNTAPGEAGARVKTLPHVPATAGHPALDRLLERVRRDFPETTQDMVFAGLSRAVDFQDISYGEEYLALLDGLCGLDRSAGGATRHFALTLEAAKQVATAMCYDDVIRVADLKTRSGRSERVRREVRARPDQLVYTTEFMHPRIEEVCATLPAPLGRALENAPRAYRLLGRLIDRGRRVRTGHVGGFVLLYLVAGLRHFRRGTLRHARETALLRQWLNLVRDVTPQNYELAVEVLKCRRLVKGYSDTHARGRSKFDRVIAAVPRLAQHPKAADRLRELRHAALADEEGTRLEQALASL
jgi:indolepyruvate ferredoxin oxidoreductase, beta subunit